MQFAKLCRRQTHTPFHDMSSCTRILPHDMSRDVMDRDGEKCKTQEGQDRGKDGKHRIDAASNRLNRATCVTFFIVIESDVASLNIL